MCNYDNITHKRDIFRMHTSTRLNLFEIKYSLHLAVKINLHDFSRYTLVCILLAFEVDV